jgi:hypothetical protein
MVDLPDSEIPMRLLPPQAQLDLILRHISPLSTSKTDEKGDVLFQNYGAPISWESKQFHKPQWCVPQSGVVPHVRIVHSEAGLFDKL